MQWESYQSPNVSSSLLLTVLAAVGKWPRDVLLHSCRLHDPSLRLCRRGTASISSIAVATVTVALRVKNAG